ncbi:MAG: alpha/beta hydrolase family protein [Acidimicrobiales bacterium]
MAHVRRTAVLVAVAGVTAALGLLPAGMSTVSTSAPAPGSPSYIARDVTNMENAFGRQIGPGGELTDPAYVSGLAPDVLTTELDQLSAQVADRTRPAVTGGNLVPGWSTGNPARVRWAGTRGQEVPVHFTAADGALLAGDVFAPLTGAKDPYTGDLLTGPFPGVVIVTGSIQASSGLYAWLAEDLAERGYVVLTFDVQGQGRSETFPHQGPDPVLPGCGTAAAPGEATACTGVPSEQQQSFDDDTEDAITFFLSTPQAPYTNTGAGSTPVNGYNPLYQLFDHTPDTDTVTPGRTTRLALIGHSTGAVTVSYLQGVDRRIETVVALDKLTATANAISDDEAELGSLPGPVTPVVPALAMQSEYGFEPQPYWEASCSSFEPCPLAPGGSVAVPDLSRAPDPNREEATGFDTWQTAGIDSMVIVPRASTHLDYTDEPPVLPASQWGQAMASYYSQAWLDKYLKHDTGADSSLLATTLHYLEPVGHGVWQPVSIDRDTHLSFYFCSGYAFHSGDGNASSSSSRLVDDDLVGDGCP